MKIGNIEFDKPIFLAPMAGYTDVAFRSLCEECGADMCYTEMVSAKGLYYKSERTEELLALPGLACFAQPPQFLSLRSRLMLRPE